MSRALLAAMKRCHVLGLDRKPWIRVGFVQDRCIGFHDKEGNNHQHLIEVYLW